MARPDKNLAWEEKDKGPPAPSALRTHANLKILVVDDDPVNRKALRAILEKQDHCISEAVDGIDALRQLKCDSYDAVISDILMPKLDGFGLCYAIRKDPALQHLPIIICTANFTSAPEEKVAMDMGANKFLQKPVSAAVINAALREIFENPGEPNAAPLGRHQELEVLLGYSEVLAAKLEKKHAEISAANTALEERARLAECHAAITAETAAGGAVQDMLRRCADLIVNYLAVKSACIWTLEERHSALDLQADSGTDSITASRGNRLAVECCKIDLIAADRLPYVADSISDDPRLKDQAWMRDAGVGAFAGYPLMIGERCVGVLATLAERPFTANALKALESAARSIALGIERERVASERGKNLLRIRALHEIDVAIASRLDIQAILDVLLEKIDVFLAFPTICTVRLFNQATGRLESLACHNIDKEAWSNRIVRASHVRAKEILEQRRPMIVRNGLTDPATRGSSLFSDHGLTSFLGVPLIVKGESLGVLGVYTKQEHEFLPEEVEFVTTLAGQAAIAIHNAKLYEQARARENELDERNRMLSALQRVASAASQSLDLDQVLSAAIEKISEIFLFDATQIHILDASSDRLVMRAAFENDPARFTPARSFKRGEGIVGTVVETGDSLIFNDVATDARYQQLSSTKVSGKYGYRFFAVFPIRGKRQNVGALACLGSAGRHLSASEIQLLEAITDQLAVAIDNAQLFEKVQSSERALATSKQFLEKSLKQLTGLYTAMSPLAMSESLDQTIEGIVERLVEATQSDATLIRVWDRNSHEYPVKGQFGYSKEFLKGLRPEGPGGAVDWVIRHGEPIIADDIAGEARLKGKRQLAEGFQSCAILPLKVHDAVRGVIQLSSRTRGYFDEEQREHLLAVARQMGIALENRELFYGLKTSRDALEQANRVKDLFLNVMSHELKTPLSVVIGYCRMIQEKYMGPLNDAQEKALDTVCRRSNELLAMINTIMEATRLDAGPMTAEKYDVDMLEFCNELKDSYGAVRTDGPNLVWSIPQTLPIIKTDANKLRQVLTNLINNAIKFAQGGTVSFSAQAQCAVGGNAGSMEFAVADTGIGIPEDKVAKIFERFYQVDSSASRAYEGAGLGLYIVRSFVDLLGGSIDVKSRLGAGSTFTVKLPIASH